MKKEPVIIVSTWQKWCELAKKSHTLMSVFSAWFSTLLNKPWDHMTQCYSSQGSKSSATYKRTFVPQVVSYKILHMTLHDLKTDYRDLRGCYINNSLDRMKPESSNCCNTHSKWLIL